MTNWKEFQNESMVLRTDEAHADNTMQCDFCGVVLGADCDDSADYPQKSIRYFQSENALICQSCCETLSMYAENRHYQEPVLKWCGSSGRLPAQHVEDLSRLELIQMARYLHINLTNQARTLQQLRGVSQ